MLKISVVIPVKNEEKYIGELLNSLSSQSRKADEIIIVDGGSKDNTVKIINEYKKRGLPINLIQVDHALPGRGRNIAIEAARHDIIAMTDSGIILDKHWLENLMAHFENDLTCEVVYGVYSYYAKNLFEKCFAIVYIPASKKVEGNRVNYPFLASTAIKKYVWEKIGGFREDIRSTEDLIFFREIKKFGFMTKVASEAIVYWRPRGNLKEAFRLVFAYSKCDALTNFHISKFIRKYIMYIGGTTLLFYGIKNIWVIFLLLLGFLINILLVCKKHWSEFISVILNNPGSLIIISSIIIVLDVGSLLGFSIGLLQKTFSKFRLTKNNSC
jgi:glycosyltransferase involved in cell wall biosynthesis